MTTVLISGASIAGPALAYWLNRQGVTTTIVERAPELRTGGQAIDLRGAGREVARRMGIEDAVRAAGTGEKGIEFVDASGTVKGAFAADDFEDGNGPTAELEILRGDLARILVDTVADDTEFLFGDSIAELDDDGDQVHVVFASGTQRSFDYVVVSEGMRSRTRRLVFDDADAIRPLGMYTSYFTIPRTDTDTDWAAWSSLPGSRSLFLRPDSHGTRRAAFSFMTDEQGFDDLDVPGQKKLLRERFSDADWAFPRVLDGMDDSDDFYFEGLGQVKLPTWSKGRVVLVGDSAYCASPISGMGTSLSLVGAYVLAGELTGGDGRFERYEATMRPYVDEAQKLPPGAPRVANPKTRLGVALFHVVIGIASSGVVRKLASRFTSPPADKFTLPDHPYNVPA
ncbi:FAD-dependent monooxygenase [Williamsia maris]|uniref:2-polyprenyl-6-methoxyphenol hydroxylase n=1 Tax=Williamsia maris TaxID=72806 RepID=A0ABT1HAG5_9NOCA|nr:FAD-dependent monooxygenase [Williamsia maris]MCP2174740.1 2-polyprenyl-6-methoxyphenol hydroxylase [Williamsia maris]